MPKKKTTTNGAGGAGIRIRMYRVGFGDFFLVTLATAKGEQHIVIDCGVFKGTSGTGDIGSIEAAIANLAKVTRRELALVIMTHRHADHIAGFGRFAEEFRRFKVGAVWMPIWEEEYGEAKKLQAEVTALAEEVQAHLDRRLAATGETDHELYHRVGNVTGIEPAAAAARKPNGKAGRTSMNAVALDLLKTGWSVKPQYLKTNDTPVLPPALAAAGLTARVLGPPPIEDTKLVKLMDLKKHVGQYIALSEAGARDSGRWEPFSGAWYDDAAGSYPTEAFLEWMPKRGDELTLDNVAHVLDEARARMEGALKPPPRNALEMAAKALDSFLNNQSLVVLFTYRGKNLLFVGDAQAGNWEHWLYDTDEPDKAPTGPLARRAQDILGSVDVYKVGHHGSTNATPIVVSQHIREGAVALCSTQRGVYGHDDTAVPLERLMAALDKRCTVVRSDQVAVKVDGGTIAPQVKRALKKPDGGKLQPGELWVDYLL
ncbi:MAG TPA: MBL fold metallo-hydrolase [Haliangiales bacterium]|nr:MBL fold metallo-hydrolase [Haliangiales bacterium]